MRSSGLGLACALAFGLSGSADAEVLFKRALAIMEAKYDDGHPEMRPMLEGYAVLLRDTGRPEEAEDLEVRFRHLAPKAW